MSSLQSSYGLTGKTALVCGSSQGIGKVTAELLAARGARVFLLARNQEKLENVLNSLPGEGHQIFVVDLTDIESLKKELLPKLQAETVHILVNNAGGPKGGPLYLAKADEFLSPFNAHVVASHLLVQTLLPGMRSAQYGRVINIISTSVKNPLENLGVSNTIRAAVANWAKTLAMELAPFGVTVNNVLPGYTKTERMDYLIDMSSLQQQISKAEVEEKWKLSVPMRKMADPKEVAEGVAFLASPAASYITGINLPIDGGRTPSL